MSAPTPPPGPDGQVHRPISDILAAVLAYATFASLWIVLSDKLVEWLFDDPVKITQASIVKGWLFVAVTSLLLYALLRRLHGQAGAEPAPTVSLRPMLLPLAMLAATILALTAGSIMHTFMHQRDKEVARLTAIADLKTRQIVDWLTERRGDARFVQTSPFFAGHYRRWREGGDLASRDTLLKQLNEFRTHNGFSAILLLDGTGSRLWGTVNASASVAPILLAAARQSSVDHLARLVGPYRGVAGNVRLDFVTPLDLAGERAPVAVLQIGPADWLYPTLQTWPAPSTSGETLLFRRDGDQVLFLNELRHRRDTAARLHLPMVEKRLLAAQALSGEAGQGGLLEGVDYRGVDVIGVARAVPGTDWFLVAKLDRAELYSEAEGAALWIALIGLLALVMAGAGAILYRQRHLLAAARIEQSNQADKLRALRLLNAIAESTEDAIYAKDTEGRYLLFNQAAARLVGKSADEVLGRDDRAIFPAPEAERIIAHCRQVMSEDRPRVNEDVFSTSLGERAFLTTLGPLHDDAGKVVGLYGVSRDVTESKQAEAALRQRNEELERFNRATVGRELDMIALKREVNALSERLGLAPPHSLAFLDPAADPGRSGEDAPA